MSKCLIYIIALCFLLFSCGTRKDLARMTAKEAGAKSFKHITISNVSLYDSVGQEERYYSFYTLNKLSLSRKDTLSNWKNVIVTLDSIQDGIQVTYTLDTTILDNYILNGHWKDNLFYAKTRRKSKGVPFILFFFIEKSSAIGFYTNYLRLYECDLKAGMIFILSGGGPDRIIEDYRLDSIN